MSSHRAFITRGPLIACNQHKSGTATNIKHCCKAGFINLLAQWLRSLQSRQLAQLNPWDLRDDSAHTECYTVESTSRALFPSAANWPNWPNIACTHTQHTQDTTRSSHLRVPRPLCVPLNPSDLRRQYSDSCTLPAAAHQRLRQHPLSPSHPLHQQFLHPARHSTCHSLCGTHQQHQQRPQAQQVRQHQSTP